MSSTKDRLYALARRLSIGRVLRYLDLWARYGWRRAESVLRRRTPAAGQDAAALAAALAGAGNDDAKRLAVSSWFPLDLQNAKLHAAILKSMADARPDLDLTPEIRGCLLRLRTGEDLAAAVDAEVETGAKPEIVNTALYLLLLRRLPARSERAMIASRNPLHALIAIKSGDEYMKQGRRTEAS
jgi:hypothetical protein